MILVSIAKKTNTSTIKKSKTENLVDLWEGVKERAIAARSSSTRRAYRYDWNTFVSWCEAHKCASLPSSSETIAAYLTHLDQAGRSPATLERVLTSLSQAHLLAGLQSPTQSTLVREVRKGIRRTRGTAQHRASPITADHLIRMVSFCNDDPIGTRDKALLAIGFAGALRRAELVALDIEDLDFRADGIALTIRKSKTDQEGESYSLGIPFGKDLCPVGLLRAWIDLIIDNGKGSLFRAVGKGGIVSNRRLSPQSVTLIVKRTAAAAGYDPDLFSAHSLRSGFATSAAAAGVEERRIAGHTRHQSMKILRRYIHAGELFVENPLVDIFGKSSK